MLHRVKTGAFRLSLPVILLFTISALLSTSSEPRAGVSGIAGLGFHPVSFAQQVAVASSPEKAGDDSKPLTEAKPEDAEAAGKPGDAAAPKPSASVPGAGPAKVEPPYKPRADQSPAEINVPQKAIHPMPIQVSVDMVVVNITVTDPYDRIVTGLEEGNFQVYDEKVPQKIVSFSTEDAPISIGLIFDSSGSMSDKMEKSKEAALEFFKTSNPQDEFMLIDFNERPNLVSAFTSKFENLQDRLITVKSGGKTALLDAIYLGMNEMSKATTNRKALLVISDGGDNHSRYTQRDIKNAVREADVEIYAVGIFEPLASRARTPEEAGGPGMLAELAEVSGGRMFSVEDANELPDIMEKISVELRNQYAIGYKPSNLVRDGRWRRIKVKLDPPKGLPPLQVYARTGYYAPTQ